MNLLLLLLAFVFCLYVSWRIARFLRILKAQLAAYRRGDYQAQLKIVERFRSKGSEPPHYLFFRGVACFELGRLEEAEQALRRSMEIETKPEARILCRDQLGRVFMEQGRWEHASACFRDVIAEAPHRGGSHRAKAEELLRHGQQHAAALEAARRAVEADRAQRAARGKLGKEEHDTNLSESLAILAWALARNHANPSEVESALNESFALYGENAKPILAELHFCAGHSYAALGNPGESSRHFKRATEIDPVGNYGRLSLAAGTAINEPA